MSVGPHTHPCVGCRLLKVIENYFFAESQPPTDTRHYAVTFAICLTVFAISMGVEDLGIILELNGIVNANLIAFILPGMVCSKQSEGEGSCKKATQTVAHTFACPPSGACGAKLLEGPTFYKGERLWATLLLGFGIAVSDVLTLPCGCVGEHVFLWVWV